MVTAINKFVIIKPSWLGGETKPETNHSRCIIQIYRIEPGGYRAIERTQVYIQSFILLELGSLRFVADLYFLMDLAWMMTLSDNNSLYCMVAAINNCDHQTRGITRVSFPRFHIWSFHW
jgi:hypothetical protein